MKQLSCISLAVLSVLASYKVSALTNADLISAPSGVNVSINDNVSSSFTGSGGNYVLKWSDFNIVKDEIASFGNGNFLNIVKGSSSSLIEGHITGMNSNVYLVNPNGITVGTSALIETQRLGLSTAKMSDVFVDEFTKSGILLSSAEAASDGVSKGMGKIKLLGEIRTNNLLVDGSQIIIKDFSNIQTSVPDTLLTNQNGSDNIVIKSSTSRIDIGGADESFDFEENYSLTDSDGLVSHLGETAVGTAEELSLIKDDPSGSYWLYDDITVDFTEEALGDFSGSLDGAFNKITYTLDEVSGGHTGLFSSLEGAEIKNLQLSGEITVESLTSDLNAGALAGSIENSTFENIEVKGFVLAINDSGTYEVTAGGLAGALLGENKFHDVSATGFELEGAIDAVQGSFAGRSSAVNHISGITYGYSEGMAAAGDGTDDFYSNSEAAIAGALQSGEDISDIIIRGENDTSHYGFMLPYFVEDFTVEYDGMEHSYKDSVDNEYFDMANLVDIDDLQNGVLIDAGEYHYDLTSEDGRFYFVKGDEKSAAGDGIYTITKKYLGEIVVGDVTITEGEEPVFVITNEEELNFAAGDGLEDLNLEFIVSDDADEDGGYLITVVSDNGNYEYTVKEGTLTVEKAPEIEYPEEVLPDMSDDDGSSEETPSDNEGSLAEKTVPVGDIAKDTAPCDFCKGPEAILLGNDSGIYVRENDRQVHSREELNLIAENTSNEEKSENKDKASLAMTEGRAQSQENAV